MLGRLLLLPAAPGRECSVFMPGLRFSSPPVVLIAWERLRGQGIPGLAAAGYNKAAAGDNHEEPGFGPGGTTRERRESHSHAEHFALPTSMNHQPYLTRFHGPRGNEKTRVPPASDLWVMQSAEHGNEKRAGVIAFELVGHGWPRSFPDGEPPRSNLLIVDSPRGESNI